MDDLRTKQANFLILQWSISLSVCSFSVCNGNTVLNCIFYFVFKLIVNVCVLVILHTVIKELSELHFSYKVFDPIHRPLQKVSVQLWSKSGIN